MGEMFLLGLLTPIAMLLALAIGTTLPRDEGWIAFFGYLLAVTVAAIVGLGFTIAGPSTGHYVAHYCMGVLCS